MKSMFYITYLIGVSLLTLAGCTEAPIARTNCWSTADSTVTASTKGASQEDKRVLLQGRPGLDVIPCI